MYHFSRWKYWLVILVIVVGTLFALPNVFGEGPALQLSRNGREVTMDQPAQQRVLGVLEAAKLTPEVSYLQKGRLVMRFASDQQREDAQQQQRPQRKRVVPVCPRRGMADTQLLQEGGKARAMNPPQRGGASVTRAQCQRVLVGGGGTMLDAGYRLDAADGLLPRGPTHPHEGQQGDGKCQSEQGENDLVRQLWQPWPQSGQRDADEQASQPEHQPGARPKLLK